MNSYGESAGNSLGECGSSAKTGQFPLLPVPTWKFGLRVSDDRGSM